MKTICISLLVAASLHAAELTITLNNPPESGQLRILLFDSPEKFSDLRDPVFERTIPAEGQAELLIDDVPVGQYALMVHHDENSDGELNKNFIGIPREPTGFANDYSPKGPPTFSRAVLSVDESASAEMRLRRPLGDRGRIGVGVGILFSSSPYLDSDSAQMLPIPAITYTGNRLQIFGPRGQILLTGSDTIRLALTAAYRPPAYEEDDSPALEGLGDRDSTLIAGPEIRVELPVGFRLSAGYEHDVLDQIGGGEASLALARSFSFGRVRLTPKAGLRWIDSKLTNHDYGTPDYRPGDSLSPGIGLSTTMEVTESWWVIGRLDIERLDRTVTDSPIVEDDVLLSGFFAVNYLF